MSIARIGFDATAAFTQGGGIGRYTRELLGALIVEDTRYRYRIFSARPSETLPIRNPTFESDNASYREIPLSPRWLYRIWYRLRLPLPVQAFTGKIDLFHSPDFVLPPVQGKIPTLLTVHDLSFAHFPETFTPALVSYLNKVVPWSVKRATHVLADSESTKQDLITLYAMPEERVTVLYSGVSERFAPVSRRQALQMVRHKYELGDAPFIITIGTLQPRKNLEMLIRAFRPVAAKKQHDLVIAGGKGWLYEHMMGEVSRQDLAGRVRFIGFVDDEDLPALYSAATLFVFPSIYEGFGLPILEAMACGTPVLASNASSLPEVAGDAAELLPPQDEGQWTRALLELIEDRDARTRLAQAGLKQARRFRWRDSARKLESIYERLLER